MRNTFLRILRIKESYEFNKSHWTKNDIPAFQKHLLSLAKGKDKGSWEQKIVNTSLPCIAVPSPEIHKITKEIHKGNFYEFLDLWIWEFHSNTIINGELICKIKDFDLMEKYLLKYSQQVDNWASVDCLKFKFAKENKPKFLSLAKNCITHPHPFTRRLALIILLKLCGDKDYINEILSLANTLFNEEHYYVNMANAWLIAECFTKHRDKTLSMLQSHNLNKFTINKAISKCRDSFRVSKDDKQMLLKFKIK